jgi:hypothetical protein
MLILTASFVAGVGSNPVAREVTWVNAVAADRKP